MDTGQGTGPEEGGGLRRVLWTGVKTGIFNYFTFDNITLPVKHSPSLHMRGWNVKWNSENVKGNIKTVMGNGENVTRNIDTVMGKVRLSWVM